MVGILSLAFEKVVSRFGCYLLANSFQVTKNAEEFHGDDAENNLDHSSILSFKVFEDVFEFSQW